MWLCLAKSKTEFIKNVFIIWNKAEIKHKYLMKKKQNALATIWNKEVSKIN